MAKREIEFVDISTGLLVVGFSDGQISTLELTTAMEAFLHHERIQNLVFPLQSPAKSVYSAK